MGAQKGLVLVHGKDRDAVVKAARLLEQLCRSGGVIEGKFDDKTVDVIKRLARKGVVTYQELPDHVGDMLLFGGIMVMLVMPIVGMVLVATGLAHQPPYRVSLVNENVCYGHPIDLD